MNGFGALGEHALGELPGWAASVPATATLYVASRGFMPKPYEPTAGTYYEGRVLASFAIAASIQPGEGGRAAQSAGELRIWNGDGWLDGALLAYAVDGREIRMDVAPADALDGLDAHEMGEGEGPALIVCDWGTGAGPAGVICDHGAP